MMNPLQKRLSGLRRRLRVVITVRGLGWVAGLILVVAAGASWLDWVHPLPSLVRALILELGLGGAGLFLYRFLIQPLWARMDDLTLALQVECLYPALTDSLATAVQFLEQTDESGRFGSPGLRQAAVQKALDQAQELDFKKVGRSAFWQFLRLALVATGFLVALAKGHPGGTQTALARLADPFGKHDWPRLTQLVITDFRPRVARGEVYEIRGLVTGVIPDQVEVEYKGITPQLQIYSLTRGRLLARLDQVRENFRFQVKVGDAISDWYAVQVLPPPILVPLQGRSSPQVQLHFPAYTDLPDQNLPDGSGNIEAVAGTQVHFWAATDRPVALAWLEYRPEQQAACAPSWMATLGAPNFLGLMALSAATQKIWSKVPVRLKKNGQVLGAEFKPPTINGTYLLHFEDETGLGNTRLFDLQIHQDPAPSVNLERPSRAHDSLEVLAGADIHVHVTAEDKEFSVRSAYLEFRTSLDASPQRLPLLDNQVLGTAIPTLLGELATPSFLGGALPPWIAGPVQGSRLRPKQVQIGRLLSLNQIKHLDRTGLKEGDTLIIQACADDFDDVTIKKEPGRSQEVELRIISLTALEANHNDAQTQVQQELLRLRKMQQEALDLVIGPEQRWRNMGRLEAKDIEQLRQAEQIQQQIRSRVGNRHEGLRAAANKLLESMRDNHLPPSGTQERIETVAKELDRLAREELEQVEPRLTNARKENETGDHPLPPLDHKGLLGEARQHQEEIENTFNDLLRLLEPWGTINDIKGEARGLHDEQLNLLENTRDLNTDKDRGRTRDQLDEAKKGALDGIAKIQENLAERTHQLLEKMDRNAKDPQGKSLEITEALRAAAEVGIKDNIPERMKIAAKDIQGNLTEKGGNEQSQSLQDLEKIIMALEDHHEKELEGLHKKLKEAEAKVGSLIQDQTQLRKKMMEAAKNPNASESERQLMELASQQEGLRKKAQALSQELRKLRADQAARALQNAGTTMEHAGQELTRNQNAEDPQQETLDRLNEAQRRLKQSQAEVRDELVREKLAKVADLIKLLKDRQETALGESVRLQTDAMLHKQWNRNLRFGLENLADSQKGLAQDAQNLAREKLTGYKVFSRILARSGETMDQAAGQIHNHLDRLKEPFDDLIEDMETRLLQEKVIYCLGQVIDAINAETIMSRRNLGGEREGESGDGGEAAADSISPLAQFKVLRAMQEDINKRTEEFGTKHSDFEKLSPQEKQQLQAIRNDQAELAQFLEGLTHPGKEEGAQ